MASLKNRLLKLVFFFVTFYSTFVPDLFFLEHGCSFNLSTKTEAETVVLLPYMGLYCED